METATRRRTVRPPRPARPPRAARPMGSRTRRRLLALLLLAGTLAAALAVSGCSGVRERIAYYNSPVEKVDPFVVYMDEQVGRLTFDEALAEWGHPSQVTDGDRIFLATWGPAEASKSEGEFGRLFLDRKASPGDNVNVVFDVTSRRLESWGFSRK